MTKARCLLLALAASLLPMPSRAATRKGVAATFVPGLATEFRDFDSPLWSKAGVLTDFGTPRPDGTSQPASQPTEARLANDGTFLFFKITATDSEPNKIRAAELDEFENAPPKGDHVEFWEGSAMVFLAFDTVGNKYEARAFDRRFYSAECEHKVRKTESGWEVVGAVPLLKFAQRGRMTGILSVNVVRHLDHGLEQPERSTASGDKPWQFIKLVIESEDDGDEKR